MDKMLGVLFLIYLASADATDASEEDDITDDDFSQVDLEAAIMPDFGKAYLDQIADLQKSIKDIQKHLWLLDADKCPDEYIWNSDLNFCFRIHVDARLSWAVAQMMCRWETKGGRLVIFDTDAKRQAVRKEIIHNNHLAESYSIGSKRDKTGHFRWTNDKMVEDITWCDGQPSGSDCGSLWGARDYCMDDTWCIATKFFVCEKPM